MMIDAPEVEKPIAVLVPIGEAGEAIAGKLLSQLRKTGIASDMAFRGNMKKRMQRADASGARYAVIVGDSEAEAGAAQVKDMVSGEQRAVAFDQLVEALKA
jgi:histidyl-tRNA synthetase